MNARTWLAALLISGALLSACSGKDTPASTPPPPSAEALDFDILAVEGPWIMRMELAFSPQDVPATLHYSGVVTLWVQLDGSISGEGQLTPNITNSPCLARVISDAVLGLHVQGNAYAQEGQIRAALELQPDKPTQEEGYVLQCGADAPAQYVIRPVLWPALETLARQEIGTLRLEALRWDVPLNSGEEITWKAPLGADYGRLTGMLRLARG